MVMVGLIWASDMAVATVSYSPCRCGEGGMDGWKDHIKLVSDLSSRFADDSPISYRYDGDNMVVR